MTVEIRYLTDPACVWSWGMEPQVRRLMWEFADGVRFRWVMGGLARSYGSSYRDEEGGIGAGGDCFADLMAHWLDATAETGMPTDPRLWSANPIGSTYPACIAVAAAGEQGPEAQYRYLRRVREGLMAGRRKLDNLEALVAEAADAGLNAQRFRVDAESHAAIEAFGADLEEVRTIPEEAREQGRVRETEGRERLVFPTAVFLGEGGERSAVYGPQPYDRYREAALASGAVPVTGARPTPLEAVERFGRCATREIEELAGQPAPVARAELWSLARDWKLRPVPALTGELWEPA